MAARNFTDSSARFSKSASLSGTQLQVRGLPFNSNKALIAEKSAKIAQLLKEHPYRNISNILKDLHIDPESFEQVSRFCIGLEPTLNAENAVPTLCLAHYLGMTETHSPNNLLKKALTYFHNKILPSWDESVKALKSMETVLPLADHIGLVDACFESLISQSLLNPRLVGEPINDNVAEKENGYAPNAKRRLFDLDQGQREELITLSVQLYEALIREMICRLVPSEYIMGSIWKYAKTWVFTCNKEDDLLPSEMSNKKEVMEAIERLLPEETKGLIPCTFLCEMLRSAIVLEASLECKTGLEIRIGKQLENAMVNDLLIPTQGYAKEQEYDVECVRRIMKSFYSNYDSQDMLGLVYVAELMDGFLAEVANDVDLKPDTFVSLAEMSVSASVGTNRTSDGIYRAIDTYLTSHKYLTESEREEVCRVLDCHTMSAKAREHAAQNDRLPLRLVVQVLFIGQLHLRDTIGKDFGEKVGGDEEIESKVRELGKERDMMRREIEGDNGKKEKVSVWREMKRKFGCSNGKLEQLDCHVKKKKIHPRK